MTFNEKKTTQAASKLLTLANKQMNYMKLIKLLYLMDRKALIHWGRPITGDQYFSMPRGPVLSSVLDLIHEKPFRGREGFWVKHISPPANYEVELIQDAGRDELSAAEEKLIVEIYEEFGPFDPFILVDHLHEMLPEWTPLTQGCRPIEYADILKAGQRTPEEIQAIQNELDHLGIIQSLFSDQ
jgi:uncharacterized phage-associated protein